MLRELDVVRLRRDLVGDGLVAGTVAAVVDTLDGRGLAYEVEVVAQDGRTAFLGPLPADALELVHRAPGGRAASDTSHEGV